LQKKLEKFRRQHKYLTKRLYDSLRRISNKIYVTCKSFLLKGIATSFDCRAKPLCTFLASGMLQMQTMIATRIAVLVDYARRDCLAPAGNTIRTRNE
jgi:hypothetical protein